AACDGFTFAEWDVFDPLPEPAHVVRAMNILTQYNFTDEQRALAVMNCVEGILPGGLFIVGSSPSPESTMIHSSLYGVQEGRLGLLARVNGGSEIDAIVVRTYRVVEGTSGVLRDIVPSAYSVNR